MRLLRLNENGDLSLVEYQGNDIPRYAILSHTWGADHEEITFRDLVEGTGADKLGYKKVLFSKQQAAKDRLQYFWIDTCCIDKSSSAELAEAINSMFKWYHKADRCYAYLSDVTFDEQIQGHPTSQQTWKQAFRQSRWFTRGWTLQELLAPLSVEFFSVEGKWLGDKRSLMSEIQEITGIHVRALQGYPLDGFDYDVRMSWTKGRETKREEDAAYALLGIFDVYIPLIYGEGRENAFTRLRREMKKRLENSLPQSQPQSSKQAGQRQIGDRRPLSVKRRVVCYKCQRFPIPTS
jgi:hypothetical protein